MAEIFTIVNQPAKGTFVSFLGIEAIQTNFVKAGPKVVTNGGNTVSQVYDFRSGDSRYPITAEVVVTKKPNANNGEGAINCSVKLRGTIRHVEDSTTPDTVVGEYPYYTTMVYEIHPAVLGQGDIIGQLLTKTFWLFVNTPQVPDAVDAAPFEGASSPLIAAFNWLASDGLNATTFF